MSDTVPFDVLGPLPSGTTVLEASAGTGKTFTLAALATRYLAEGLVEIPNLLMITFGRAASRELRERVRARLVSAHRGLADADAAGAGDDPLVQVLASVPDAEARRRRQRLARAIADFDAATITTTHGFCHQVLGNLGVAGDRDPDASFLENSDDLMEEVLDDVYIRRYAHAPLLASGSDEAPAEPLGFDDAVRLGRAAIVDPNAELVPRPTAPGSSASERVAFCTAARGDFTVRKRRARLLDFDDLQVLLRDALRDPHRGPAARSLLRERFHVVLVDEFQDTDPVQWEIVREAFSDVSTVVLVGDPKQAIYAFRGGDLVTYLRASAAATHHRTLARNYRSDARLIDALHILLRGAALGSPDIAVKRVEASRPGWRLSGVAAPIRLRLLPRDPELSAQGKEYGVEPAREAVANDLARDVVETLRRARLMTDDPNDGNRSVRPGDIAVLVNTNAQASLIRGLLVGAGVPAVVTGTRSVFVSVMAGHWLRLLRALTHSNRSGIVRSAALTVFVGWSAEKVAEAGEADLDALGEQLREWRYLWRDRGVAALAERVVESGDLMERLLATSSGERDLTDLRHVASALHEAATTDGLGPTALVEWLEARSREGDRDSSEERSQRLESDADAVQVITVHRSKGLEFPLVYVPYAWDRYWKSGATMLLHDDTGTRVLDVGGTSKDGDRKEREARARAEELGEDLRRFYVAVTRAAAGLVLWWAPTGVSTKRSPLHRVLFGDFDPGEVPAESVALVSDDAAVRRLGELAAGAGGDIAVESVPMAEDVAAVNDEGGRPPVPGSPEAPGRAGDAAPSAPLSVARFDRSLDLAWGRHSYTALTAAVHGTAGPSGVSEPEDPDRTDEPALVEETRDGVAPPAGSRTFDADEARLRAVPSPMADLPAGTGFGTRVHAVLEHVDTSDPEGNRLAVDLRERCGDSRLADALGLVMDSPLGPLAPGVRLRHVLPGDRLAELEFELPLAGGDGPRAWDAALADVASAMRGHLPPGDLLEAYPDALDRAGIGGTRLRGYLTGSIDAVVRVRGPDGEPRYLVVDYKTNWLGPYGGSPEPLSAWHYRPEALASAMIAAHYPLQALLYSVALHRFLRWRLPAYDPHQHLGGVLYLFVRGMCGPATPLVGEHPCGVFSWSPPYGLVEDVSALLDRGPTSEGTSR